MKKLFVLFFVCSSFIPLVARADVVSGADVQRLDDELKNPSDQMKQAVAEQYGSSADVTDIILKQALQMSADPEWKTVRAKSGITFQVPWSPTWYVLGKQIPYFGVEDIDKKNGQWFVFGKYVYSTRFTVVRPIINVWIEAGRTVSGYAGIKNDDENSIFFTLNGRKALLTNVNCTNLMCGFSYQRHLLIEVKKGKLTYLVDITEVNNNDVNDNLDQNAFRVAASIK